MISWCLECIFSLADFPFNSFNSQFDGAVFWSLCPTVRTGQVHISRAFMCANTPRPFIFHLIWAARSSRAHQSLPCPDSHQNIDPCHSCAGRALQIPQKCPSAFLFSCLSGLSHAYGNHPVRLLVVGLIWPDKKSNWFQNFHNNIWRLCFFSSAY